MSVVLTGPARPAPLPPAAAAALERLVSGNRRFATGRPEHPHQTAARRAELVSGQQPFAAVLGCADARVPPEIVFDQGLGDLFVIRVAGNIADEVTLASIAYAVHHLSVPLLIVLGHARCGAVAATLDGAAFDGPLARIASAIQPAVEATDGITGDPLDLAVRANALLTALRVRAYPPVAELVATGQVAVLATHHDLVTGTVQVLS
jgi:carbonic anhydrase